MLKGHYRIKKNRDFRKIFDGSRGIPSKYLVLYYRPQNRKECRFGFVVSKKVGGAVVRNRTKRVLREIVRKLMPRITPSMDIILIARPSIRGVQGSEVEQSLLRLLAKQKLIVD